MSESMIERVARALATSAGSKTTGPGRHKASDEFPWQPDGGHLQQYVEKHWREHTHAAELAIEAMREPTKAMLACDQAVAHARDKDDAADIWRGMIDAAFSASLKEST